MKPSHRAAVLAFLAMSSVGFVVSRAQQRHGAVAQVDRLYACVTPAGTVSKVRAYHIGCPPADQTVTWKVNAP